MASFKLGRCLLQEVLLKRGLTQQELAERLDMSKQQVSNYANNRRTMSLERALQIAEELRCHPKELYEQTDVKPQTNNCNRQE